MIYFDFLCTFPLQQVLVEANSDGSSITITRKKDGQPLLITDLKLRDRMKIREMVQDWVQYFKDMEELYKTEAPEDQVKRTVMT